LAESLPLVLLRLYALHATITPYEAHEGVSKRPDRANKARLSSQTNKNTSSSPEKRTAVPQRALLVRLSIQTKKNKSSSPEKRTAVPRRALLVRSGCFDCLTEPGIVGGIVAARLAPLLRPARNDYAVRGPQGSFEAA